MQLIVVSNQSIYLIDQIVETFGSCLLNVNVKTIPNTLRYNYKPLCMFYIMLSYYIIGIINVRVKKCVPSHQA